MRQISNQALKTHFIAWQCRIRQMAARDFGGQPMPAMRPRASTRKGTVLLPAMTVLLVPLEPGASTAFFRFQQQKTNEAEKARQAGLGYLAGDFYQLPELFSDEMTAVFGPFSDNAAALLKAKEVLLECVVGKLKAFLRPVRPQITVHRAVHGIAMLVEACAPGVVP